jgi:pimeloyl-ACP methyl ester carboxylesterase
LSSGGVELKGPKRDEALVFADTPSHSGETGAGTRVAYLPGWLARRTFFVLPDVGQSVYPEHAVAETLANAKGCRHVRVSGAAHLVVQERPQDVAEAIDGHLRWLTKEEGRAVAKL